MALRPDIAATGPSLEGRGLDEFVHRTVADPDLARGPAVPIRPPVMARGEAVWAVVCATLVRNIQAKMPEPEDDDEPDDAPEDKPDDESEDDPGTLYFGQKDG